MKYIGLGVLVILLMSGCVRRFRHIPIDMAENNETNATGELYVQSEGERYHLKPEPYSQDTNKTDPEISGLQNDNQVQVVETQPEATTVPKPASSNAMTKQECISLIGLEKFERYSKRFGGESGALKRCAIIKKLKG